MKVPFYQLYHLHAEGEKEIFSPVVISEKRRQIDETNLTLCSNTGLFSFFQAPPLSLVATRRGGVNGRRSPRVKEVGGFYCILPFLLNID